MTDTPRTETAILNDIGELLSEYVALTTPEETVAITGWAVVAQGATLEGLDNHFDALFYLAPTGQCAAHSLGLHTIGKARYLAGISYGDTN